MPTINYIQIFKDAWQITWKNRFLWWFGLLIAIANPGGMNYLGSSGDNQEIGSTQVSEFMSSHIQLIIAGAIILLAVLIVLAVLGIIARAGLIGTIDNLQKNLTVNFKSGMKEGKKYFGKLFLLGLTIFFLVFASIIVLAIPIIFLIMTKAYALGIFLGILAFFILIPVLILAAFLRIFGYLYIVLGKLSAWNALERSYELFRNNLLANIIMWLLFVPIGFALMLAIIAILILLAIVFIAIGFGLYFAVGTPGAIIAACIGVICFLAIILVLRSVYETFAQAAWYLFFLEIAKPKVEEKVEEVVLEKKEEVLPVPDPVKTVEIEK